MESVVDFAFFCEQKIFIKAKVYEKGAMIEKSGFNRLIESNL